MTDTTDQNSTGGPKAAPGGFAPNASALSDTRPATKEATSQDPLATGPQAKGVGVANLTGSEQIGEPAAQSFDRRLIEDPIVPTLLTFSLPLVWSSLMHSVVGTYSAAWVGQVIGPAGLTAVVICNVIIWMMLMSAIMGMATASNIFIAQAYGAKNLTQMKTVTGTSIVFVVISSVMLAGLGWVFTPALVALISTPVEAYAQTIVYLRASCVASIAIFPFVFITIMIRGTGDARTPLVFTAIWLAMFCLFGPAFLVGAVGLPKLGLAGMAYGGGLSAAIALVMMLAWTHRQRHALSLQPHELTFLKPDRQMFSLLVRRGSPIALEGVLISGVYLFLLSMVNRYGAETSAAYSASTQLWGYVQMPIGAIAASVSSIASQNIGAGRWDRVGELAWKSCAVAGAITTFLVVLIYGFGDLLLGLFLPDGGETLSIALRINLLVMWSWIPLAVTLVLFGVVRANGAMMAPALIMIGALWLIRIPFAEAMQPVLGADAIWWSFPAGTISCAALAYAYYRWGDWRSKTLMDG